jgi:hypothetical protein
VTHVHTSIEKSSSLSKSDIFAFAVADQMTKSGLRVQQFDGPIPLAAWRIALQVRSNRRLFSQKRRRNAVPC